MRTPVEVASMLIARSRNSADLEDSRNVHRYSSKFALYESASSLFGDVTHRRDVKVPTSAKQYLDAEYLKWYMSACPVLLKF